MSLIVAKLLVTLKRFWWIPLVVIAVPLAYVLLGQSSGSGLIKMVKKTADARREELEALDRAAASERAAIARARDEHAAAVKREAAEHERKQREIDGQKRAREAELAGKPVGELTDALAKLIDADNHDCH